jgi:hypothetical protein
LVHGPSGKPSAPLSILTGLYRMSSDE